MSSLLTAATAAAALQCDPEEEAQSSGSVAVTLANERLRLFLTDIVDVKRCG